MSAVSTTLDPAVPARLSAGWPHDPRAVAQLVEMATLVAAAARLPRAADRAR